MGDHFHILCCLLWIVFVPGGQLAASAQIQYSPLCPKHCVCLLRDAFCSGAGLTRLPRYLPHYAETIRLQENSIRRLKYSGLKGLRFLKHLLMKGNDVSYIEPGAFRDMTNLVALSLTDNKLRKLHHKTFKGLSKLKMLSLRNNQISELEKVFTHLHGIQLINLGSNKIHKISNQAFSYNWQLQVLDLHDNRIRIIDKFAFRTLPLLKYLVLRDNPIKNLDLDFRVNQHLELLDFSNCQLTKVVQGLPHSINDLRMSENQIRRISSKDFRLTKKIRLLVLNNNMIESISEKALSRMWRLYDVYLGKNQLKVLPSDLPAGLRGLYANYNNISSLPSNLFFTQTKLQKLYLRQNKISAIDPEAFKFLSKLRSLDLSKNSLHHIQSGTFQRNQWLEMLDLSSNPIQTLDDDCFRGLKNLHILQLSSVTPAAQIEPAVFQDMKKLLFLDLSNSSRLVKHMAQNPYVLDYLYTVQDLNLMNDKLYYLPSSFPTYFPFLKMIKLVGNPWHCDTTIYWLTLWMRNNSVQFFAPQHMRCASPLALKGRHIVSISADELATDYPPMWSAEDNTAIHPQGTIVGAGLKVKYADTSHHVRGYISGQHSHIMHTHDRKPPNLSRHKAVMSPRRRMGKIITKPGKSQHHNMVGESQWSAAQHHFIQHRGLSRRDNAAPDLVTARDSVIPIEPMDTAGQPLYDDSSGYVSGEEEDSVSHY